MNKIIKIVSRIHRALIKLEIYIDVDKYLIHYVRWLKKQGMIIKGNVKFISPDTYFDGTDYSQIEIGDNVTISREVTILNHDYSITTAAASVTGQVIKRHAGEMYFLKPVKIGNNCFIGAKSFLLPGTVLGDNCIVGGGSVVRGTIPNNSVLVGNPARIVKHTDEYAREHLSKKDFLIGSL